MCFISCFRLWYGIRFPIMYSKKKKSELNRSFTPVRTFRTWTGTCSQDLAIDHLLHRNSESLYQESLPLVDPWSAKATGLCSVSCLKSLIVCASVDRTGKLLCVFTIAFVYYCFSMFPIQVLYNRMAVINFWACYIFACKRIMWSYAVI